MTAVSALTTVFAHAGHWAASVAYMIPVFALAVGLGYTTVRERRRLKREGPAPQSARQLDEEKP